MSLLVVAAVVVAYLIIVVLVLSLLMAAKRGDEAAEREHRALARSMRRRVRVARLAEDDREKELAERRRAG